MNRNHAVIAAVVTALAMPTASYAAVNLVQNGDFTLDTPANTTNNGNFQVTSGTQGGTGTYGTLNSWAVSNSTTSSNPYIMLFNPNAGANVSQTTTTTGSPSNATANLNGQYSSSGKEYLAAGYNGTSPTGGNFVAMDGDTGVNGYLSQSITGLTTGALYELTFYWAVGELASRAGTVQDALTVNFGSSSTFGSNASYTTQTYTVQNGAAFTPWMKIDTFFTATAATQYLSFLSVGAPAGLPPLALLDGINLTAAPEPATWAIFGVSIAGLAFFARRRSNGSRSAAAA